MKRLYPFIIITLTLLLAEKSLAQEAHNPVIFADVTDLAMIRVNNTYYMSSTTMHMSSLRAATTYQSFLKMTRL